MTRWWCFVIFWVGLAGTGYGSVAIENGEALFGRMQRRVTWILGDSSESPAPVRRAAKVKGTDSQRDLFERSAAVYAAVLTADAMVGLGMIPILWMNRQQLLTHDVGNLVPLSGLASMSTHFMMRLVPGCYSLSESQLALTMVFGCGISSGLLLFGAAAVIPQITIAGLCLKALALAVVPREIPIAAVRLLAQLVNLTPGAGGRGRASPVLSV